MVGYFYGGYVGTDLDIFYKGELLVELGRVHYYLENSSDIESFNNRVVTDGGYKAVGAVTDAQDFLEELIKYAAYAPKSKEEVSDIAEEIKEGLTELLGRMMLIGKQSLLLEMLESNSNLKLKRNG